MYPTGYSIIDFRTIVSKRDRKNFGLTSFTFLEINSHSERAAMLAASESLPPNCLRKVSRGKKILYVFQDFASELLIRRIAISLKELRRITLQPRDQIVETLLMFLIEGVQYRIYRLDIQSFFESIDTDDLLEILKQDFYISRKTIRILEYLLKTLRGQYQCTGLPRGIGLSSVLSEVAAAKLDHYLDAQEDVFYFGRFVDDIIIVTSGNEDPGSFLPGLGQVIRPLRLNRHKNVTALIKGVGKRTATDKDPTFEYLGYRITVSQTGNKDQDRKIVVRMAKRKAKKIKTRLARAFQSYSRDNDFTLLRDRIRLLTSNYEFYDAIRERRVQCGLAFSYKHLNDLTDLGNMDRFLRWLMHHNPRMNFRLSRAQKSELKRYSFLNGFKQKRKFHFEGRRLAKIQSCWIYE